MSPAHRNSHLARRRRHILSIPDVSVVETTIALEESPHRQKHL